ncbi:MAG: tetratricopeptide repeat protein [Bacteroidia bacterium]|nr:tetratricopeptide repeat protein [Bacteroidia bacterium]
MKKLLLLLFLFPLFSSAQNTFEDSLLLALKHAPDDTTRCHILNILIESSYDEKKWPVFNDQMMEIAKKNFNSDLKSVYLRYYGSGVANRGYLAKLHGQTEEALKDYAEALKIFTGLNDPVGIAGALTNTGMVYFKQRKYDLAIEQFNKALAIQETAKDKKGLSSTCNDLAGLYVDIGNTELGFNYYFKSLQLAKETKDKKLLGQTYNNIGALYKNLGNVIEALNFYHLSLKLCQEIGDKYGLAGCANNIGQIYKAQSDYVMALEYFNMALKLCEESKDKEGEHHCLTSIGAVYRIKGDVSKALEFYFKAMAVAEKINDQMGVAMALNNMGVAYDYQKDPDNAISCFKKALAIREKIMDKEGQAYSLNSLASVLISREKYGEAETYAARSLVLAKELGYPDIIMHAAGNLSVIYKKQNKLKDALTMYELKIQMRDSLSNEQTKKASFKSQLKYEYEKKTAADSVKNAETQKVKDALIAAQTSKLKQEKTQRYALDGGLLIVIGFLIFIFNRFRVTRKQKKIIETQKQLTDEAFEKLHQKNQEVMDSIFYARKIQRALITPELYIERSLKRLKN